MSLEEIVQRFRAHGCECRWTGREFRCQCPAHPGGERDAKDRNLSLSRGTNGCVLVNCHSHGCDIHQVAGAVGLTVADFGAPGRNINGGRPAPEAVYPYRDERGRPEFEIHRLPGKKFVAFRREGDQLVPGMGRARRLLFGLPELLATKPGDLIAITEGEKDAVNLAAAGVPSTTNPFGAEHWVQEQTDWLKEHLADRRFVILPDNDEKGQRHADQVYHSLKRAGLDCRIIALPDLPEKGDVSDWLKAGGTGEALIGLTEPQPHPLTLTVVGGAKLAALKIPPPEALVPNLVYRGFSTLLAGDSKLGKSSLLLRMMLAMASGGWWLDRELRPENRLPESRVLFVNFEDPLVVTQDRALRMMRPEGIPEGFMTMPAPYDHRLPEVIGWLHEAKDRFALDAVVLDPIAVAAEWKDETDNSEVMLTFKGLQRLAAETGLAVLSSHHVTKKPGTRGLNIRGGSAIKANVMGYLVLEEEKDGFRLAGINKWTGFWDVLLQREEDDLSWWIERSYSGHTRTPQQAWKDAALADLLSLVREAPGATAERLAELLGDINPRTCRRYLDELEQNDLVFHRELPREPGQRGQGTFGWFPFPDEQA